MTESILFVYPFLLNKTFQMEYVKFIPQFFIYFLLLLTRVIFSRLKTMTAGTIFFIN